MTKWCNACQTTQPLDNFGRHKKSPDGLRGHCRVCNNRKSRAWREANPDKAAEAERRKVAKNPDKYRAISANHYAANKDAYKARARKWDADNPERRRTCSKDYASRRRARYSVSTRYADPAALRLIWDQCPDGYEVDHIVPLNGRLVSGLHVPWNLQYLTAADNREKGNKWQPWVDSSSLPEL